jgi:hypothetical protein
MPKNYYKKVHKLYGVGLLSVNWIENLAKPMLYILLINE